MAKVQLKDLRQPITLAEMARAVRIRWHVLRRAAVQGRFPAMQLGGHWLCDAADIAYVRKMIGEWAPQATRAFAVNERLADLGITPRKGRKPRKKKNGSARATS